MQKFYYSFAILLTSLFLFASAETYAQAVKGPASLDVYEASGPITVDGILDETDWAINSPNLVFRFNGQPSDRSNTPDTLGVEVKAPYTDTSICNVKFLHYSNMLYVSLKSDDKQVGIYDWEGDGMFMKIVNGAGQQSEFKLYIRNATHLFGVETGGAAIPDGAYGGEGVVNGTVLDSSDTDNGYTAEGFIDLSQIFDVVPASVQVMVNIFDPDYYTLGSPAGFGGYGSFAKQWWGTEWGGDPWRTLNLVQSQSPYDPASLPVYIAAGPITIDGILDEPSWTNDKPYLMFKKDGDPSGNAYVPTNAGLVVKTPYTDISTCNVKFLQYGNILYVALQSDDQQVGIFDWEGDGMFMKIVNGAGQQSEFKLYIRNATHLFGVETGGAAIPDGAYGGEGVVNGTVLDSSDTDNGYTAEGFIDLSQIFDVVPASVQVMVNIFDPDYYTLGSPAGFGGYGSFAKQWWGTEWGGDPWRTLTLESDIVPVELTSFSAKLVGSSVQLNWTTATELNNTGFEVQRKSNNSSFAKIGFVNGQGTSTQTRSYTFVDNTANSGASYSYRLKQIDLDGTFTYSQIATVGTTLPTEFSLSQNYPNPFNPTTRIEFSVPVKSDVSIEVYNLIGQKVIALTQGQVEAGSHYQDLNAYQMASGIYLFKLTAVGEDGSRFVSSKKMTLLK